MSPTMKMRSERPNNPLQRTRRKRRAAGRDRWASKREGSRRFSKQAFRKQGDHMSNVTSDPSRAPWAKRWLIGAALVCPLFSVAHGADTVRIAHDRDFPPFSEVSGGKSEGLAVDIIRAAAARA